MEKFVDNDSEKDQELGPDGNIENYRENVRDENIRKDHETLINSHIVQDQEQIWIGSGNNSGKEFYELCEHMMS